MARPQKEGLDYFPLDVDIADDDKMELIEAKHGLIGFAIVIRLLMRIYKSGYYYKWTEKEQLLFSKRINVDINIVNEVINDAVKWELFDKKMLTKHEILTSKGIQKRYLEAVKRRQKVELFKIYLLLKDNCLNEYTNIDIVNINSIDDNINPQRKVKESKVNNTTENNDEYSKEYETFWEAYPRKKEKKAAFTKFKATKNKGIDAGKLILAASNYRKECELNCTAENYIKLPRTFLGPDEHWREYLEVKPVTKSDVKDFTGATDEELYGGMQ